MTFTASRNARYCMIECAQVKFLASHVDSWQYLLPGEALAEGFGFKDSESVRIHDFLEAALVAVDILRLVGRFLPVS